MIETDIKRMLKESIESLGLNDLEDIPLERPRDASYGDLATPVAMVLASKAKSNPRRLAQDIVSHLGSRPQAIEEIRVEGPGFINFILKSAYYHEILREIIRKGESYGRHESPEAAGKRILVEFVSSNPTGPLTIGHGRQAVLGDVIANMLEWSGCQTDREYYFNDAGRQMDLLGRSVYARYAQTFDADYPFPEDGYRGDYILEIAKEIRSTDGDRFLATSGSASPEALDHMRAAATRKIVGTMKIDLEDFRIVFDSWYNESSLLESGRTRDSIERLRKVDAIYEKDGALWFRATRFGDEEDRVLIKRTGEHTYFLTDIAYHITKAERGYTLAINLHGADHHGYIPRVKAAMRALGYPDSFLRYLIHQMVTFMEGGEQWRMSTRAGTFVTLRELMDKVGVDVARYFFVMMKPDSHLVFDLDLAQSRSMDNPVYYLQYANARISSIFKFAEKENCPVEIEAFGEDIDLGLLGDPELELAKKLSCYPETVGGACESLEPHRLTAYLEDLAATFHQWYEKQRVVTSDRELTLARLYLCHCVRVILRSTLGILGVTIPDQM